MSSEWYQAEESTPVEQPQRKRDWREGVVWGPREVAQGLALGAAALIFIPVAALIVAAAVGIDVTETNSTTEVSLAASLPFEAVLFGIVAALTVFKCHARWSALGFRPLALRQAWVPPAVVIAAFVVLEVYADHRGRYRRQRLLAAEHVRRGRIQQDRVRCAGGNPGTWHGAAN